MHDDHQATEQISLEEALARLPAGEQHVRQVLARLNRIRPLPPGSSVVDIGAAQGRWVIGCTRAGYRAVGIEPWDEARAVAARLAAHVGLEIQMLPGVAESIPLESGQVDVVLAQSVIEHVRDADVAFREVFRILKPGGVFWFYTASSVCPRQGEIRRFPLFGWYPDALKRRIMAWAAKKAPHLVGHTTMPAIHWFTPRKARRMLHAVGFTKVYDRWDLRLPSEGGTLYRMGLRTIQLCRLTKLLADVVVPSCAYAAIK